MVKKSRKKLNSSDNWPEYNVRFDPDEFRKRLRLDRNALDEEVEFQAALYGEVADASAQTKSTVDSLDEQIKELEAKLDAEAREDAEKSNEKITESAIKAIVARDERRKAVVIQSLKARDLHRRLEALAMAFRQRSYMLRDMVELHLSEYYSTSSIRGTREGKRNVEVERISSRMKQKREHRSKQRRTSQS